MAAHNLPKRGGSGGGGGGGREFSRSKQKGQGASKERKLL